MGQSYSTYKSKGNYKWNTGTLGTEWDRVQYKFQHSSIDHSFNWVPGNK